MEIRIELGADIRLNSPVMKVELYKTHEAFLNPSENPGDCFNCCTLIPLNETSKKDLVYSIIKVIETSVNVLMRMTEDIPAEAREVAEKYGEALKNLADR